MVLFVLAAIQFVHVLDFVVVMPLAPLLMRDLKIDPATFSLFVSSYNIAAAISSLAGAVFLDRFDRRRVLLVVFAGLALSTLICAAAPNASVLIGARFTAGLFGGLIQALLFAIVGDRFREGERANATATIMSAFSVASVVGIPLALFAANAWSWRTPFLALGILSVVVGGLATQTLPPLLTHLKRHDHRTELGEMSELWRLMRRPQSQRAFLLIASLMFAGFSVIPFLSIFLVANVGLSQSDLASVFFISGVVTFITTRIIGRLTDRVGKLKTFTWAALFSALPVLFLTQLGKVPYAIALATAVLFTLAVSARGIPALAMVTASVDASRRGRFLSLTSSVQQASSALATLFAGWLLVQDPSGRILHFGWAGAASVFFTITAIFFAYWLQTGAPPLVRTVKSVDTRQTPFRAEMGPGLHTAVKSS